MKIRNAVARQSEPPGDLSGAGLVVVAVNAVHTADGRAVAAPSGVALTNPDR